MCQVNRFQWRDNFIITDRTPSTLIGDFLWNVIDRLNSHRGWEHSDANPPGVRIYWNKTSTASGTLNVPLVGVTCAVPTI